MDFKFSTYRDIYTYILKHPEILDEEIVIETFAYNGEDDEIVGKVIDGQPELDIAFAERQGKKLISAFNFQFPD